MTTETTTRTTTIDYDNEGRICHEITITTVETSPGAGRGATDASARIVRFLEEQASLGRDGTYEIWADKQRPQHVITLGDLRELLVGRSGTVQDDGWPVRDCDHSAGECTNPAHQDGSR